MPCKYQLVPSGQMYHLKLVRMMKCNSQENQEVLATNIPKSCFYLQSQVGIDAALTVSYKSLFAPGESTQNSHWRRTTRPELLT